MEKNALHIDLHLHSNGSSDSLITRRKIEDQCFRRGLDAVFITDHNNIQQALRIRDESRLKIYIGEEITTREGEVIGLFLEQNIPPFLPIRATIDRIKTQGGVVYIPHPFDRLRKSTIQPATLLEIISEIDIIEVFNSRVIFKADNLQALHFALQHDKIFGAGSDAHIGAEIGKLQIEMEFFFNKDDFLAKLPNGTIKSSYSNIMMHGITKLIKLLKQGEKYEKQCNQ